MEKLVGEIKEKNNLIGNININKELEGNLNQTIREIIIKPTGNININSNGIHDVAMYGTATVNVSNKEEQEKEVIITNNGITTVIPDNNKTLNKVNIITNVPKGEINLQSKEATPSKSILNIVADSGFNGLDKVTINPIPDEYIIPTGKIDISSNGDIDVTNFSTASVNVPSREIKLQSKEITPSKSVQEINPDSQYDGLNKVTVNAIPNEYIIPSGTINISENGEVDISNYAKAIVNVSSGGGLKVAEGTFTLTDSLTEYTVTGLDFTPRLVIVTGTTLGTQNPVRTAHWYRNSAFNAGQVVSYKSATSVSPTLAISNNYCTLNADGFKIKQYLTYPLIADTYSWIAVE